MNDDTCCNGRCDQGDSCPLYRRVDPSPKGIDVSGIAPAMHPGRWLIAFLALALLALLIARIVAIDSDRAEAFRRECRERFGGSAVFDQRTQRLACRVPAQEVQQP
jgi:hypothetical protein